MSSAKCRPFCLGLNVLIRKRKSRVGASVVDFGKISPCLICETWNNLVWQQYCTQLFIHRTYCDISLAKFGFPLVWMAFAWNVKMLDVNTLRPRQNGRDFADDTFKRIFWNENVRISIQISPRFVPKSPIDNVPALVQIMAWRRSGDKPLSESMMAYFLTHICVTRPQWVNVTEAKT